MKSYASNEELFTEIAQLAGAIEESGQAAAAKELRFGLSCLNGLTDGWALLMESVAETISCYGSSLTKSQLSDLHAILETIKKVVYR
jgi:hypothetical protein